MRNSSRELLLPLVMGSDVTSQVKLPKAVKAWPVYALPSRDSQGRKAMKDTERGVCHRPESISYMPVQKCCGTGVGAWLFLNKVGQVLLVKGNFAASLGCCATPRNWLLEALGG